MGFDGFLKVNVVDAYGFICVDDGAVFPSSKPITPGKMGVLLQYCGHSSFAVSGLKTFC